MKRKLIVLALFYFTFEMTAFGQIQDKSFYGTWEKPVVKGEQMPVRHYFYVMEDTLIHYINYGIGNNGEFFKGIYEINEDTLSFTINEMVELDYNVGFLKKHLKNIKKERKYVLTHTANGAFDIRLIPSEEDNRMLYINHIYANGVHFNKTSDEVKIIWDFSSWRRNSLTVTNY